ncbi:hypothetical protein [Persephonella sp.]|uniref:hypothetical protein n=1 Tax=Persephonella sp. TaxID=2060922 RepID=UPI00262BCD0E|nr:hypothetical protein [Persephonella sp.]
MISHIDKLVNQTVNIGEDFYKNITSLVTYNDTKDKVTLLRLFLKTYKSCADYNSLLFICFSNDLTEKLFEELNKREFRHHYHIDIWKETDRFIRDFEDIFKNFEAKMESKECLFSELISGDFKANVIDIYEELNKIYAGMKFDNLDRFEVSIQEMLFHHLTFFEIILRGLILTLKSQL